MKKVKFLVDFRGKLTKERFYAVGEEDEFHDSVADSLVDEGRAEFVKVEPPAPAKKTTSKKAAKK